MMNVNIIVSEDKHCGCYSIIKMIASGKWIPWSILKATLIARGSLVLNIIYSNPAWQELINTESYKKTEREFTNFVR